MLTIAPELVTRQLLRRVQASACAYCGCRMTLDRHRRHPTEETVDHVTPMHLGGRHDWTNRVLVCHRCNVTKGNSAPTEAQLSALQRIVDRLRELLA